MSKDESLIKVFSHIKGLRIFTIKWCSFKTPFERKKILGDAERKMESKDEQTSYLNLFLWQVNKSKNEKNI